ncbi:DUF5985 family protein [Oligoflexus tunisiensis]|uniref:DUF5985 family protein n=1 Tax=Oligoflexus tunisiensis TaxID=708132 RepID=UPI00114C9ADF|nr:DUF5985 family protein [Oligoflexus tunisiensis]
MAEIVYILCALTSALCAVLLVRRYRTTGTKLLLWTSLSFIGLALNNGILLVDTILLPNVDFLGSFWRNLVGACAGSLLLLGLIWEVT